MSRTLKAGSAKRRCFWGKEYWKSRLHPGGESPSKGTKIATHRKERRVDEVRDMAERERDLGDG